MNRLNEIGKIVKAYRVEPVLVLLGETEGSINFVRVRTICDVLRNMNKMDREIFNKAIQGYVKDPKKNIPNPSSFLCRKNFCENFQSLDMRGILFSRAVCLSINHGISTQIIGKIKNVQVPFNVDTGVGDVDMQGSTMTKAVNDATLNKAGDIYQYLIALKDCSGKWNFYYKSS